MERHPDVQLYASASKGYKPGGYNPYYATDDAYDKEILWQYEVGKRLYFLDDDLYISGALFNIDLKNMQYTSYKIDKGTYIPELSNREKVTSQGVELETKYKIDEAIKVFATAGMLEAYNHAKQPDGTTKKEVLPNAPKQTASVGLSYDDGKLFGSGSMAHTAKSYIYLGDDTHFTKARSILNAKVGYRLDNIDITLYGKNLTDAKFPYQSNFGIIGFSPRREFGVTVSYLFD